MNKREKLPHRPGAAARAVLATRAAIAGIAGIATIAAIALPQAGCTRRVAENDRQGRDVQVDRGPGGTEVELKPDSQAVRDLQQAGERAGQAAQQAGDRLGEQARQAGETLQRQAAEAGRDLEQGAREVGAQVAPAARQAGQALEESARKVGEEVGPIAREVLSDASITARIKAKLITDPEINPFHIDVDTVNGIVTLNGEVASGAPKQEAEKLARQTDGVKQVNNLIQVKGEPPPPPPARR